MHAVKMSATDAKLQFGKTILKAKSGTPILIEKNNIPEVVLISIDDYEDFLEVKDAKFQKTINKASKEMQKGEYFSLDDLYEIHKKTILKEAKK